MKTENLTKAYHSAQFLAGEIRQAHTDAIYSGNAFAEVLLYELTEQAVKIEQKLQRLATAAHAIPTAPPSQAA
jgi:hypothetical protein